LHGVQSGVSIGWRSGPRKFPAEAEKLQKCMMM